VVSTRPTGTAGRSERKAALAMLEKIPGFKRLTQICHRGLARVGWMFTLAAAAYNLVPLRTLGGGCYLSRRAQAQA
jgi:hypothetical protein